MDLLIRVDQPIGLKLCLEQLLIKYIAFNYNRNELMKNAAAFSLIERALLSALGTNDGYKGYGKLKATCH